MAMRLDDLLRILPPPGGRTAKALLWLLPAFFFAAGLWAADSGSEGTPNPLGEMDCVKCHAQEVADLQQGGGGHATLPGCIACHPDHPPGAAEVFLPCQACHSGSAHVERQGPCLPCHRNPHRPKEITPVKAFVSACLDCHPAVGKEFADAPSIHARFACISCHESHPEAFPCLECHKEHVAGTEQECQGCHPPHRPTAIVIAREAGSPTCLSCHAETGLKLEEGGSAHRKVGCAGCHSGPHGAIPQCEGCHPSQHPEKIVEKFGGCAPCHGDAHTLRIDPPARTGGGK